MKKHLLKILLSFSAALLVFSSQAQCDFIRSTSLATDTLSYNFVGGSFVSYGCAPIDPTYWLSGSNMSVTITFVNPEDYPSFRVWGMNDDDTASVIVNGSAYPLTAGSASYDLKTVCGLSPGPLGVLFANGKLVGSNNNVQGNFSFNNVTLNTTGVNTITINGLHGAGWGFAGVTVNCSALSIPTQTILLPNLFPNPTTGKITFQGNIPDNTMVTLTNALGECVSKIKLVNNTVDISELPQGIYLLSMELNNQIVSKRIIKF